MNERRGGRLGSVDRATRASALALAASAVACGSSSGGPAAPTDGGDTDVTVLEGGMEAAADGPFPDAGDGGLPEAAAPCHHEVTNPSCWAGLDIGRATSLSDAFFGAATDGRYVYIVSQSSGAMVDMVRVDPQVTSGNPFSIYDPYNPPVRAIGFATAGFDGRYV